MTKKSITLECPFKEPQIIWETPWLNLRIFVVILPKTVIVWSQRYIFLVLLPLGKYVRFKNIHQHKVACLKNYHSLVFTKMVVQASQLSLWQAEALLSSVLFNSWKESQNDALPKKILGLQRRRVILLIKLVLNVRFRCNESNNTSFKVGNVSFQNTFN